MPVSSKTTGLKPGFLLSPTAPEDTKKETRRSRKSQKLPHSLLGLLVGEERTEFFDVLAFLGTDASLC